MHAEEAAPPVASRGASVEPSGTPLLNGRAISLPTPASTADTQGGPSGSLPAGISIQAMPDADEDMEDADVEQKVAAGGAGASKRKSVTFKTEALQPTEASDEQE